jgi:hypothetical protein
MPQVLLPTMSFGSLFLKSCEKLCHLIMFAIMIKLATKTNKKVWMMNVQGLVHKMPNFIFLDVDRGSVVWVVMQQW